MELWDGPYVSYKPNRKSPNKWYVYKYRKNSGGNWIIQRVSPYYLTKNEAKAQYDKVVENDK